MKRGARGRGRWSWVLSAAATALWAMAVLALGLGQRVLENWEASLTMAFGSFFAGSSPLGGGAVAFPVFTKAMDVPGPVARTFGLCIQAVGMTMASVSILASARPVHRRAVAVAVPSAVVGFVGAVWLLGRSELVFWPSAISAPWVKASFSIVLASTSIMMLRHLRSDGPLAVEAKWNLRHDVAVGAVAVVGGLLSSLTGTGANVLVFLFLIVLVGVNPKIAVPSAVLVMTAVSIVGFVMFGLVDGQLDVEVAGDRVVAVGDQPVDLDAGDADLLGLWLAAVPVVLWAAPLGSLAASLVAERHLVRFVAVLAAVEVATTFVLVPELRSQPALLSYLAVGLVALPISLIWMQSRRDVIFGQSTTTS